MYAGDSSVKSLAILGGRLYIKYEARPYLLANIITLDRQKEVVLVLW